MRRKKLKWGQTPWDKLSREELLRTVQRYHSALSSLDSCMSMSRAMQPESLYWGKTGSGGRALAKSGAILDDIHGRFFAEDIYRSFFRYADDLLFPAAADEFGPWGICLQGHMWAPFRDGEVCSILTCKGPMRRLQWSDLSPSKDVGDMPGRKG